MRGRVGAIKAHLNTGEVPGDELGTDFGDEYAIGEQQVSEAVAPDAASTTCRNAGYMSGSPPVNVNSSWSPTNGVIQSNISRNGSTEECSTSR